MKHWRSRLSGRWWVTGVAFLVIAVLAGTAASILRRDPPRTYRFDQERVLNAPDVLDEAERAFLRGARREDASLASDAQCYFSQVRHGSDIRPELRCGPILHFGGNSLQSWDNVTIRLLSRGDGGVRLQPSGTAQRGTALVADEILSRPDRAKPRGATSLRPPPPPRLLPGQVTVLGGTQPDSNIRPIDAAINGPGDVDVRIEGLGVAREVRLREGPRRPARGEELIIVQLNVREAAGATLEIVAGERRSTVRDPVGQGRDTVVASVPSGVEAKLDVTFRGITQGLSLRTGLAVGSGPVLIGERPRAVLDRVVERQQVPFSLASSAQPITLGRFTVVEAELLAHSEWLGTAPPGTGWLALELQDLSFPFVLEAVAVRLNLAASLVFVLSDGTSVPATELGMPSAGRTAYFSVPDAVRSGIVRIKPTFDVEGTRASGTLVFGATELTVDLRPAENMPDGTARH